MKKKSKKIKRDTTSFEKEGDFLSKKMLLEQELIDKVVASFPHLNTFADNIKNATSESQRIGLQKQFARTALAGSSKILTPQEIMRLGEIANMKN